MKLLNNVVYHTGFFISDDRVRDYYTDLLSKICNFGQVGGAKLARAKKTAKSKAVGGKIL